MSEIRPVYWAALKSDILSIQFKIILILFKTIML